jgi:hypothetical protein
MGDASVLPGLALVAIAAGLVLVVLLGIGVARPGPRRAGLVAGGLPLCLLPTVVAAGYGSWKLDRLFGELLQRGPGAARGALEALASLWAVQRIAWGAALGLCLFGLLIGLLRFGGASGEAACSRRRAFVLLLLPVLALAVASWSARPLAGALRVSAALISFEPGDREGEARLESVLEGEGLQARGSGSIGAAARFLARTQATGIWGGGLAGTVLLGLALPGFILAWRVRFGGLFAAAASVVWLLAAAGAGLVALGVLDPLRLT